MITSIITGDIINSRKSKNYEWIEKLKEVLNQFGKEPKQWEIYRGDSFQLEIPVKEALKAAIQIKATIKQNKELDVRLAIGIGEKEHQAKKITESNGSAFVFSGECFDQLKKTGLAIKTNHKEFDESMNLYLDLALLTMNSWTPNSAEIVKLSLENPNKTQKELAKKLNITQSNVSARIKRSGFDEIMRLENHYRKFIKKTWYN